MNRPHTPSTPKRPFGVTSAVPFLILLGVLAAGYAAAWITTAMLIERGVDTWAEARRADGYRVLYGEPYFTGFPTQVIVNLPGFELSAPASMNGVNWRTAAVRLRTIPLTFSSLTLDLAGSHALSGNVPPLDSPLWLTAARADVLLTLDSAGQLRSARLDAAEAAAARAPDAPPVLRLQDGSAEATLGEVAADGTASSHLAIRAAGIDLPEDFSLPPMERTIRVLRFAADVRGRVTQGALPQVLDLWRRDGGTVEMREASIDWPPLRLAAVGTLALDEDLQPIGAFNARFQGFFDIVDALTAEGSIRSRDASMAKVVLALLAKPSPQGGGPELSLPVTIQDRKLYAGPVMLMEMPDVAWPASTRVP